MRNHPTTAARADIGRTPQLCQDALIEMLKELFAGKLFCGQEGRKALKIYKQDLPIPQSSDADVDTDAAEAPYIVVRMTGGQIEDDDSPQTVDFSLIVCAYDTGLDREGWQDVANIKEDIIQRVCKAPYFGGAFTVLKPKGKGVTRKKKEEHATPPPTTPEITEGTEAKTERKTPCVYCGPSVRGVARQYTVYASGNTPAALDEFVKQHPAAKNLLVPVERFAETRKALETAGTAESILYTAGLQVVVGTAPVNMLEHPE